MTHIITFRFWLVCAVLFFVLTGLSHARPSPSSVPIYEDPLVTVYDDESSNRAVHLAVVHKAGRSDPLFDVTVVKGKDQYGFDTVTYQLDESNVKHVELWMGDAINDPYLGRIVVEHYLDGETLDPEPGLNSGYGRGRAIANYILVNKNQVKSRPSPLGRQPTVLPSTKWVLFQPEPVSDHRVIGRSYINTYEGAANWRSDSHIKKINKERLDRLKSLVSNSSTDELSDYGYDWAEAVGQKDDVSYYLVESKYSGRINIVAVHDNISESDYIVDLDPLLTRTEQGRFTLSYLLTEDEIQHFNQSVSKALRHIDGRTDKVEVAHYIRGKKLGLTSRKGGSIEFDIPVFSIEYQWHDDRKNWRPSYETPTERNSSGIGRFFSSRYSFESIRELVLINNRQRDNSNFLANRPPIQELYLALNRATPAVRKRWGKYALWTDAYWVFYDLPMGRQLIDGKFDQFEIDADFRSLYVGYIQAYSEQCEAYIKNPTTIEHVYTQKEVDGFGITLNQETSRYRVTMDARALANYEKFYNNQSDSGRAAISVIGSLLKGGNGFGGALGRSLSVKSSAEAFVKIGKCQSSTQQRFAENLLRRASEEKPLTSKVKPRVIAQVTPPKLEILPSDLNRPTAPKVVKTKPVVFWPIENQAYEFPSVMPIDNVIADFLLVKFLDKEITKATWESMLISRWTYDTSAKDGQSLIGGRFFAKEAKRLRPTIERVEKHLSEFQSWMRARVAKLPKQYTLSMTVNVTPYGSEFAVRPQAKGCALLIDQRNFQGKQQAYLQELSTETFRAQQYCQSKNRPNVRAFNKCLRTADHATCNAEVQAKQLACVEKRRATSSVLSPLEFSGLESKMGTFTCGGSFAMGRTKPEKLYSEKNAIKSLPASHVNIHLAFDNALPIPDVDSETFDQRQPNAKLNFTVEIKGADIIPRAAGKEIAEINLKLDTKVIQADYEFLPLPQKRRRRVRRF